MKAVGLDEVLAALQAHVGAQRGITAACLAAQLDISPRQLRRCISALRRREGIALCGHPDSGYYIADSAAELERTCAFLRARALHSLTLESRLRRIPLADLIGQLKLET